MEPSTQPQEVALGDSFDVQFRGLVGENLFFDEGSGAAGEIKVVPLAGGAPTELANGTLAEDVVGSGSAIMNVIPDFGVPSVPYQTDLTPGGTSRISDLAGSDPIESAGRFTLFDNRFVFRETTVFRALFVRLCALTNFV